MSQHHLQAFKTVFEFGKKNIGFDIFYIKFSKKNINFDKIFTMFDIF